MGKPGDCGASEKERIQRGPAPGTQGRQPARLLIRGPLRWMGGKARLASRIARWIPETGTYVEVFGGGAHVLFHLGPITLYLAGPVTGDPDRHAAAFTAAAAPLTAAGYTVWNPAAKSDEGEGPGRARDPDDPRG